MPDSAVYLKERYGKWETQCVSAQICDFSRHSMLHDKYTTKEQLTPPLAVCYDSDKDGHQSKDTQTSQGLLLIIVSYPAANGIIIDACSPSNCRKVDNIIAPFQP